MANATLIFVALAIISVVYAKPPQKIVGGGLASEGEIPYIVSINRQGQHFCGGSIISNRHILTAAHCVIDLTQSQRSAIRLRTGCISTKVGGKVHTIAKIDIHPNYDDKMTASPNDIAVITVKGTITFDKNTKKIDLINVKPKVNTPVIASGWGLRSHKHKTVPTDLYTVKITIAQSSVCRRSYPRTQLQNSQVCTIGPVGQGVCMGDSGGPLELDGQLAGVVSFGRPCATGHADVFSSVHYFKNWIETVMDKS